MPQPHDVGSVLGGRYKVTGQVTTSADQDFVLDGVDQVLDRRVSILIAGEGHAEQMAISAREIATGERPGSVQVLDLGQADGGTYLVTNHAAAADLLDLVVAANPPYVEPFFTDTLGTEIFGQERSQELEYYDDRYRQVKYDDEPAQEPPPPTRPAGVTPPPPHARPRNAPQSSADTGTGTSPAAGVDAAAGADHGSHPAQKPKVTLWSDDDYGSTPPQQAENGDTAPWVAKAGAARAASRFPASARGSDLTDDYDEPEEEKKPRFTRWLAGAILAILLISGAVLAVTQLGSMFSPTAAGSGTASEEEPAGQNAQSPAETPSPDPQPSESATESASPSAEAADPVIDSIVRVVPEAPDLDSVNDGTLPLAIDDNPGTAWNTLVYANNTFGGFASNLALVLGLEEESGITEVQIEQLNGSGGNFEILLNDEPSLEGAEPVAQGSFTSPSITIPVPNRDGAARTAKYVILNFTQLPRLSNNNGPFPWGIKLAEIDIS